VVAHERLENRNEAIGKRELDGGVGVVLYSVIMFIVALVFMGISIAIYNGKTDLIHEYHQTKVTDKAAYGKAFGKAMLIIAIALLLSGMIGLIDRLSAVAVAVLAIGLVIGVICIVAVQIKYNKGIF
jgi:uncharacterized membrane-anchored protein